MHHLCSNESATVEMLSLLLQHAPEAANGKDGHGWTSLRILNDNEHIATEVKTEMAQLLEAAARLPLTSNTTDDQPGLQDEDGIWFENSEDDLTAEGALEESAKSEVGGGRGATTDVGDTTGATVDSQQLSEIKALLVESSAAKDAAEATLMGVV